MIRWEGDRPWACGGKPTGIHLALSPGSHCRLAEAQCILRIGHFSYWNVLLIFKSDTGGMKVTNLASVTHELSSEKCCWGLNEGRQRFPKIRVGFFKPLKSAGFITS